MAPKVFAFEGILIGSHAFSAGEQILRYKMLMSSILIWVFVVTIGSFGAFRFVQHEILQAVADTMVVTLLLLGWLLLRRSKRYFKPVSRFLLLIGLILALLQMIWFPESKSRLIWFSTAVYIGFFLLDRREGWVWIGTIVLGLGGVHLVDPKMMALEHYEFMTFVANLVIIALLLGWYETFKEQNSNMYERHRIELEETLREKTSELQLLNATLHQRVNDEIEKNREKEKHLIYQSRLAQMGEMISMIAHQWRQPLAAIAATASAMQLKAMKGQFDQTFYLEALSNMNRYSKHLSSTIDDFRSFFKPNKEKQLFSLKDEVERALEIIGSMLQSHHIEVSVEYKADPKVFAHANEVRQVILNLIKNAEDILIEKRIDSPKIEVVLEVRDEVVLLTIGDNGGGFDEAIKERLFEPYFTTKEKRDGTGLGLYMSKTIIEEHCKGGISARNGSEGAIFELKLPLEH